MCIIKLMPSFNLNLIMMKHNFPAESFNVFNNHTPHNEHITRGKLVHKGKETMISFKLPECSLCFVNEKVIARRCNALKQIPMNHSYLRKIELRI